MKKRLTAWVRINRKYPQSEPANASEYIKHFDPRRDTIVVLYCRVSSIEQYQNGNLANQQASLCKELKRQGVTVLEVYRCVESSWDNGHWMDRPTLAAAAGRAKELGAVLVFESTSRLIRNIWYHPSRAPDVKPNKGEYEKVKLITKNVTLASIAHPDLTPAKERGVQTRRGMAEKNKKGGRPRKRTRRQNNWPQETISRAIELRDKGKSYGEISKTLNVPRSTVQSWIKSPLKRGV